jgi:hypothetical protein
MVMYWVSSNQMSAVAARKTMKLIQSQVYHSQFLNISFMQESDSATQGEGGVSRARCLAVQFNEDAIALAFFFVAVSVCKL